MLIETNWSDISVYDWWDNIEQINIGQTKKDQTKKIRIKQTRLKHVKQYEHHGKHRSIKTGSDT